MPEATEAELIAAATSAVKSQLAQGNVRLISFRMKPVPEVRDVADGEVSAVLTSPISWRPRSSWEEWYPSLDVTAKRERAWRNPFWSR